MPQKSRRYGFEVQSCQQAHTWTLQFKEPGNPGLRPALPPPVLLGDH